LGNGAYSNSVTPVQVSNLSGVAAIAAGIYHSFALTAPLVASQAPAITSANGATFQVGQAVSFAVTTTGSPTPSVTESGALPNGLTFVDNGDGTGTLGGTVATGTVGNYNITFIAPNGVTPNATQSFSLTVAQASTTTALIASPNPANSGQAVTLTATVAVVAPGSGTPDGTVAFSDNGTLLTCSGGNQTVSAGQATCQYTFSTLGSHPLTAAYSGSADFGSSSGPTPLTVALPPVQITDNETITVTDTPSFPDVFDPENITVIDSVSVTALSSNPTTISINALPTITYPGPVTLSASIQASAGVTVANGTVTFTVSQTQGGCAVSVPAVSVVNGSATSNPVAICGGTYRVTASYTGNISFGNSTTPAATQFSVNQAGTSVQLTTSASGPVADGTFVGLTARVIPATTGTPTGTITFLNGSTTLGTATLSQGVATLTTSTLPSGADNITANYGGDTNFTSSTSPVETVSVNSPDYTASANPSSLTLAAGQTGTTTMTVTPQGYSGTVSFSCGNLRAYITCAFNPTNGSVTFSSGATTAQTLTLSVTVASTIGMLEQSSPVLMAMIAPLGLLGLLPLVGKNRKRLRLYLGIVALALTAAGAITGCSSAGSSANLPPAGTQTFTVTAAGSSSSGTISHQLQLTINITN